MNNLKLLTIESAIKLIKTRQVSITDLVNYYRENITKYNSKLNCIITLNDQAVMTAREYDAKYNPEIFDSKPLFGLPIIFKDNYLTENIRTTAGSKVLENYIPTYNATVVQRMINAGAIIIAKANMDAWAHGSSGENSDFGNIKNPYNLLKTPGGSSSGSAVSIASDMCLFSFGTDTGGSIRQPASFCNLTGLKPTYGRVSRYGVIAMASSFDTQGHFTRNVYDSDKILSVTSGLDQYDATTSSNIYSPTEFNGNKYKIGLIKQFASHKIDPVIDNLFQNSITLLQKAGHQIVEIDLPSIDYSLAAYYILVPSEISSNLGRYDGIRFGELRDKFGQEAKRRIIIGTFALSSGYYDAYYKKALKVRKIITNEFSRAFLKVDVLVSPVSPTLPFNLGEKVDNPLMMYLSDIYTCPVNLAGLPAISVPCGQYNNLPVGIQFIADQFKENLLFDIGVQFEQIRPEFQLIPKY